MAVHADEPGGLIKDDPSEGLAAVLVDQLGERMHDLKRSSLSKTALLGSVSVSERRRARLPSGVTTTGPIHGST